MKWLTWIGAGARERGARTLAILAVLLLSFIPRTYGQSCPPQAVFGTVTRGDASTADVEPPPNVGVFCHSPQCGTFYGTFNTPIQTGVPGGGPYGFSAFSGQYFYRSGGSASCSYVDPCWQCTGGYSIALYARWGNVKGHVYLMPSASPVSTTVGAAGPRNDSRVTDANGAYDFCLGGAWCTNNWGLVLVDDGTGRGIGTYQISANYASASDTETVTINSSENRVVDLFLWTAGLPVPDTRACPNEGEPVNVSSGNVFFDQTDAVLSAFGKPFTFIRSYNSVNRGTSLSGIFGPGWTHEYERALLFPMTSNPALLMMRGADGTVGYFEDNNNDSRYDPSVPFNRDSWIQRQPDSSFIRYFRKGGLETYSSVGQLTSIIDASGNTTTLTYSSGRLATVAAPGGRTLTLAYDASNRVSTLSGPAGVIATYIYDGLGRLSVVVYADLVGSGYTFTYDASTNAIATVADGTGRVLETHLYDTAGRGYTSEISAGQERRTLAYGPNATTVVDALNNTTTYEFVEVWGQRKLSRATACASCGGASETQSWTYDDKGRVLTHTDGNGKVTRYTYDPNTGDQLTVTDPLSHTTTYTYDAAGRVLTRADASGGLTTYTQSAPGPTSVTEKVTETQSRTTSIFYQPNGLLSAVIDPRTKVTSFGYNVLGDLVSVTDPLQHTTGFDYDAMGRRTRVTDPLLHVTQTVYDVRGHVTQVTDSAGKSTYFAYDAGGRRTGVTDALGRVTQYAYDPFGRLATVTDALQGTTRYTYDLMSKLTGLTDARSNTTTFEYDILRRMRKVTYPGGAFDTFDYDPAGRLLRRTDRRGIVTTFSYDAAGRLTGKSYSDATPLVTYSYDPVDRMLTAANFTDTVSWTYDLAGQMLSEKSSRNVSTVDYTYDLGGNRLTMRLNGGLIVSYGYDDDALLRSITSGGSFFLSYDSAHRRGSLAYPNGVGTMYTYDTASRLTQLLTTRGASTITDVRYTYDEVGNRTGKREPGTVEAYGYDALYRLTQVVRGAETTERYTYDAVGNRLTSLTTPNWAYDTRNRLLSQNGATYAYDANGNLTQKVDSSGAWRYEWNAENQLTGVFKNGPQVSSFAYDPLGRRVTKVAYATTTTTSYTYDGEDIVAESPSNGPRRTYLHGPGIDEPLAQWDSEAPSYLHQDGLGSIVKTTSSSGTITATRRYDAFGQLKLGATNGYAFTGREWDAETGLYYYRARYYDPKIGRFLSEDPIGFGGGVNFYTYVGNNPVNWTDPLGLKAWTCKVALEPLSRRGITTTSIPFFYHEYICVFRNGKMTCGSTTPAGAYPGPGMPTNEPYEENRCKPMKSGDCFDECLERKIKDPNRPFFAIGPSGTDCQEWTGDTIRDCFDECLAKATGR